MHVLRCFEDDDIQHVANRVDPIADAEVVETELMLADLDSLEKRVPAAAKRATGGDKEAKVLASVLGQALDLLREGKPARLDAAGERGRSAAVRAGAVADGQAGAVCLQRRGGGRGAKQRPVGGGLRQGRARGGAGGRRVGRDRGGAGRDGCGRTARIPGRAGVGGNRPRPRDPCRLRPADAADLLHGRTQGIARMDRRTRREGARGPPARFIRTSSAASSAPRRCPTTTTSP